MEPTPTIPADQEDGLRRQLGSLDAAAIFVGIILGSGIFVAPAAVAAATASPLVAVGLWLVGGVVAACGAFTYAECGARLPKTGGFYVYYRESFGQGAAFVGGWAALVVTYPASLAAIAHILAQYLAELVPGEGESKLTLALVASGSLAVAGGLNIVGVRAGANAQRILTTIKVLALAVLCGAALVAGGGPSSSSLTDNGGLIGGFSLLLMAVVVLLWTYEGWSDVTLIGGELRDPGRNFGRTVVLGTCVLVALYVLVQISVTTLLAPAAAAGSEQVVADAVGVGLGSHAARGVALLVVISTFGAINGVVLTASRLGYGMANDGAFLRFFAAVHPKLGTPARSVVLLVVASIGYALVADFRTLLAFFSFNVWIFYATTAVALLVLRRRQIGEPPAWRAPGGLVAPVVVLLTAVSMTTGLLIQDHNRSLVGLCMLLAGIPVYLMWRRK